MFIDGDKWFKGKEWSTMRDNKGSHNLSRVLENTSF
jgi:hypothetical protein